LFAPASDAFPDNRQWRWATASRRQIVYNDQG
jgi:hypothetical protein